MMLFFRGCLELIGGVGSGVGQPVCSTCDVDTVLSPVVCN